MLVAKFLGLLEHSVVKCLLTGIVNLTPKHRSTLNIKDIASPVQSRKTKIISSGIFLLFDINNIKISSWCNCRDLSE